MDALCNRDHDGNCVQKIFPNKSSTELSGASRNFKEPLISNEEEKIILLCIGVIVCMMTSVCGVLSNVINVVVYWKQGLKDSITLGFFALSVSDLILVMFTLLLSMLNTAKNILPNSKYDFDSINYVSTGWGRDFLYSTSCLITTFLSLERCCCIVLPFKVHVYFTRKKTVVFLSAICIFHVACFFSIPATAQLRWQLDPRYNETLRLLVWFTEFGQQFELIYIMIASIIVPVGTQVIVTVCAFIMVHGLRKSSQFRADATKTNVLKNQTQHGEKTESKQAGQFSNRDARLVKTMIFLVIILSACNIPYLGIVFAWRTVPDLNIGEAYQNTLLVLFDSVFVISNINASSNLVVYYKVSTRFREVARGVFCRGSQTPLKCI